MQAARGDGTERTRVTQMPGRGVFSSQMLRRAIEDGLIKARPKFRDDQIQPASLDLRLGNRAYRLRSSFLPGRARVRDRLSELQIGPELDLGDPAGVILDPGHPYLVELAERLVLPPDIRGRVNPRSSTGRLDIFTRAITDRGSQFDEISAGYEGPLWLEVYSGTFTVQVRKGLALAQLRLSSADEPLSASATQELHEQGGLVFAPARKSRRPVACPTIGTRGLLLGVNLPNGEEHIGWRAKQHTRLLDLSVSAEYEPLDFWEPVFAEPAGHLVLAPNDFYLLASKEYVRVPPSVAAEMVAYDPTNGELRTHYAGFFDPGFGHGNDLHGTRAVLEVRAHDVPFMLEDGQPIARLAYERMAEIPDQLYGSAEFGSHFQHQTLSLSKQFRPATGRLSFRFVSNE